MDLTIRPATPRDATELAAFIDMAGDGLPSYFWSEICGVAESPFEFGRSGCLKDDGHFSYRNAHIAEIDGAVAGGLIGYRLDGPIDLGNIATKHAIAQPVMRLEAQVVGYWYVNVLAVHPELRGRGIGTALLAQAEALASQTRGTALIVASENVGAMRLYEKVGYSEKSRLPLVGYPGYKHAGDWVLLTKPHS